MVFKVQSFLFLAFSGFAFSAVSLRAEDSVPEVGANASKANVTFQRHQFTISRNHGKIYIDGTEVSGHVLESHPKELKLIETFDGLSFASDRQFFKWASKLHGTRTYTYDEVTQVGNDGIPSTKPLVFFDKDQRTVLDTSWQMWLNKRQEELEEANRVRLAKEQEARLYQQQSELQQIQIQAALSQVAASERAAASLSVISGETSLWEVELVPWSSYSSSSNFVGPSYGSFTAGTTLVSSNRGGSLFSGGFFSSGGYLYGYGSSNTFVKSYGRTSQAAIDNALQRNPGYRVGAIRRLAGY